MDLYTHGSLVKYKSSSDRKSRLSPANKFFKHFNIPAVSISRLSSSLEIKLHPILVLIFLFKKTLKIMSPKLQRSSKKKLLMVSRGGGLKLGFPSGLSISEQFTLFLDNPKSIIFIFSVFGHIRIFESVKSLWAIAFECKIRTFLVIFLQTLIFSSCVNLCSLMNFCKQIEGKYSVKRM